MENRNLTIQEINKKMEISRRKIYALGSSLNMDTSLMKLAPISPKEINNKETIPHNTKSDTEIDRERKYYDSLKQLLLSKIETMELTNEDLIVFLRDDLGWKWKEIQKVEILSYSKRQLQRKYNKTKLCRTMSH